jgi:carboxyl-terminal processing protease
MFVRVRARAYGALVLVCTLSSVLVVALTPTGAAPLDTNAELKIVKAGYDAIRAHLYTDPDTALLLTNAQDEARKALDQPAPTEAITGTPDQQWEIFAGNIRALTAASTTTKLPPGDLAHRLVANMAKTVADLHTYFLDPKAADTVRREMHGDTSILNFGFLSLSINDGVYVKEVVPHSPIAEAGAKSGDHLLSVDGQNLTPDSRKTLLGAPVDGRDYTFSVQHAGDVTPTTLTAHMHRYTQSALVSQVVDGHIGYIRTFAFYDDIPKELDEALTSLHAQHVDSLIIDFRGNGGGTNVDHVMGRFLPQDTELGVIAGRTSEYRFVAQSDGQARETLPVTVLVDEGSASSSEIAALAFQEYDRATVIGAKTAGALGTTERFELGDGSMLSITTAIYKSAKGAALNGAGVVPDQTTQQTIDDVLAGRDPQLDAAIMHVNTTVTPIIAFPPTHAI